MQVARWWRHAPMTTQQHRRFTMYKFAIALTPVDKKAQPVRLGDADTEEDARSAVLGHLHTLRNGGTVNGHTGETTYDVFAYAVQPSGKPGELVIVQRVRERPNPYAKPTAVSTFAVV